ncbi:MAG: asparagine synthase (glutamine-hydrolyzing) [Planctomycetota bacterium]
MVPGCLHLRGMFAFAIWDDAQRTLLLARDRLGVKPLVYWQDEEGLRFASELKSLVVEPGFPKTLDERAVDDYLAYQYIPYPRTIFRAARKLPPGRYAIFREGELTVHRYWRPDFVEEVPKREEEYIEELRATLTEATKLRLISDVPLGAFLSGGIDSTIVAGLMTKVSNAPVKTFSIGFPVKEYDESKYARIAAEHLGTIHEEFIVEPDALDVVNKLAWHYDEPFADSSAVPTYYVSKLSRQRVTVALTGDGGDEMFAGYLRYKATRIGEIYDQLPGLMRKLISAPCWQWLPSSATQRSSIRRVKRLINVLGLKPEERYAQMVSIFSELQRRSLYTQDFLESLGNYRPSSFLETLYDELPNRDFLTRTMYVDLGSYLPCDILTKVDIASMANGLECRGPFLDQEVAALSGRMPRNLKLRGWNQKYILKKAFAEFLPPVLRDRPKMGFGVPIDRWLRHELSTMVKDLLLSPAHRSRGWFEDAAVTRLVDDHISGRWDHSARLWALVMLELWARNFLD